MEANFNALYTNSSYHGKILAIDDMEDQLIFFEELFQYSLPGLAFYKSLKGMEGFESACINCPDVILLDIQLPDIDGYEVCTHLKSHHATRHIPIIMITGSKAEQDTRVKALETGADAFLSKPVDCLELVSQIKAMLRIKKAEDILRQEKEELKKLVKSTNSELKIEKERTLKSEKIIRLYADIIHNMQSGMHLFRYETTGEENFFRLIETNPKGYEILGLTQNELVGRKMEDLLPLKHKQDLVGLCQKVMKSGNPSRIDDLIYNSEGDKQTHFRIRLVPLPDQHLALIFDDISAEKAIENAIINSLKEKEILLREIHHRIKNNLAMVSSLLSLQAGYIDDEQARIAFTISQKRITSIGLLHEKLYRSPNIKDIDFGQYTRELVDSLSLSYSDPLDLIRCRIEIKDIHFNADRSIPLGLIITELVTNSMKYAKRPDIKLSISIKLEEISDSFQLTVSDNGPGFPPGLDWRNAQTLGIQLVLMLVKQLGGDVQLEQTSEESSGAVFRIRFPKQEVKTDVFH